MDTEQEEQQLFRAYRENIHLLDRHELAYEACRRQRNQLKKDCEAKDAEIERLQALLAESETEEMPDGKGHVRARKSLDGIER